MSPNTGIIVNPGGKLVVDGGTLTSACPGEMWQGIEVIGNPEKRQLPQWQGVVELTNGATIENAHCAIHTGLHGDSAFVTTGGIILADSAFFINNRRSVALMSYTNHNFAGVEVDNVSHFNRCEFRLDNDNLFSLNNSDFVDHVTMWNVRGINFRGCFFTNLASGLDDRRHAIYTIDAGFSVDDYCRVNYLMDCECPTDYSRCSTFSGFATAVEVYNSEKQQTVDINHAQFDNNGVGVRINSNDYATVTRNTFNLDDYPESARSNVGLYLNTCSGFKVEGNNFERTTYPTGPLIIDNSTGIEVKNTGSTVNELYKNDFSHLTRGISASGGNSGLQIGCGTFTDNSYDILIPAGASIAMAQGSLSKGADINFSNTRTSSIYNSNVQ